MNNAVRSCNEEPRVAHRRPALGSSQATEPAGRGQRLQPFVASFKRGPVHFECKGSQRSQPDVRTTTPRRPLQRSAMRSTDPLNAVPTLLNSIPRCPTNRPSSVGNRVQHRRNRVHVPSESPFSFRRNTQLEFIVERSPDLPKGSAHTVDITIEPLRDELYLVSWQEATGNTVVHLEDFKAHRVHAFLTMKNLTFIRQSAPLVEVTEGVPR